MFPRVLQLCTQQQQKQKFVTLLQQQKRAYTPSIKFQYGDRAEITRQMANQPRPSWMVTHGASTSQTSATRQVVENTSRYEGKPLKHGPLTTKVTHMESTWFGNPFKPKPTTPIQFDDKAVDLINMGGAL